MDDSCGLKVVLDELGDESFFSDEVDHGDVGDGDDALGDGVSEWGDAVDDDEGVAHEGGFDGGGTAGDDGGAGVEEGGACVVDKAEVEVGGVELEDGTDLGSLVGGECGGQGEGELQIWCAGGEELGGAKNFGEVGADLFEAAAGEEADPLGCGVERVACGEFIAGACGERFIGEWVADELGVDAVRFVEGLFKGKDDEHVVDVFFYVVDAVFFPGPELGADEEEDGDAQFVEVFCEGEVEVGEVDEDGYCGAALADSGFEAAEFAVDLGQVEDDFGDAHDGDVFAFDDALATCGGHAFAAHSEEGGGEVADGGLLLDGVDELGSVVLTAGLACGDEDERRVGGLRGHG